MTVAGNRRPSDGLPEMSALKPCSQGIGRFTCGPERGALISGQTYRVVGFDTLPAATASVSTESPSEAMGRRHRPAGGGGKTPCLHDVRSQSRSDAANSSRRQCNGIASAGDSFHRVSTCVDTSIAEVPVFPVTEHGASR
jgi:hypothetical protein